MAHSSENANKSKLRSIRSICGAAVVFGEKLWIMGGTESPDQLVLNSVVFYELETDKWSAASPLLVARSEAAAVVLEGQLLVIGGFCDDEDKKNTPQFPRWKCVIRRAVCGVSFLG